ncbi:MAG: DNA-binding protein [Candidatus Latescibacterota bacterium]|nr:MAG: DNA-binding protein [Candidatus Latescibacterota bacterium]
MDEYYSVKSVASVLSVPAPTLRRWLREGLLHGEKIRGRWSVSAEELLRLESGLLDEKLPVVPHTLKLVKLMEMLDGSSPRSKTRPLSVLIDLEEYTEEDVADLLTELSTLYRALGGDGLVIQETRLFDLARESVPV